MGASHSKNSQSTKVSNGGTNSKSTPPLQEKHNSADSKAPLAKNATSFTRPRNSSVAISTISQGDTTICCTNTSGSEDAGTHVFDPKSIQTASLKPSCRGSNVVKVDIDAREGHSNVSRPPPPPRLRHLSELIDPADLAIDSHVRSPSGNILAPEQFLVHPDRPRSIRERQEQIREKVRAASRLAVEAEKAEEQVPARREKESRMGGDKKKRKRRGCSCFTS